MENQRVESADEYLTRRERREAERLSEQSLSRANPSSGNPHTDPVEVLSSLQTDTGELLVQAGSRRRDVRAQAPVGEGLPKVRRRRSSSYGAWLPRAGAVGALAAATIAVPLAPDLLPNTSESSVAAVMLAPASSLDTLIPAEQIFDTVVVPESLQEDPAAYARSVVAVSRLAERDATACDTTATTANGALAAASTLNAATVVEPVAYGSYRISSSYGPRYIFGRYSDHAGTDFAASMGTPIHSVADGVVEYVGGGKHGRSGMLIIIRHEIDGQIYRTWYGHMYTNGVYVSTGQSVKAGEVIGAVGSNGNSTGPHVHFEVHLDDNLTTTNPQTWLAMVGAERLTAETIRC